MKTSILQNIILKNKRSIDHMIENLDKSRCHDLFKMLKEKDTLYFSGVGKNLHIANIVASTFNSLTIRSIAIDPVACVHGDMGIISNNSTIILITKSGNTQELQFFCEKIRSRTCGSKIILIHSNEKAILKKYSDFDLFVPFLGECDPWDKVPTCSLICYLILLHSIAMNLIEEKGVTIKDFYRNHPGGDIGKMSNYA